MGLRERLTHKLRRWLLPFWAVFETDLATLLRSWVLRAWLVLSALLALMTLLDRSHSQPLAERPGGVVVNALLHPVGPAMGESHALAQLLRAYVVVWVAFVIVLTGGTISSELGVVADSVLSRGISRWQYFLGKWFARLIGVLGVYVLVMVPTSFVLWYTATDGPVSRVVTAGEHGATLESVEHEPTPWPEITSAQPTNVRLDFWGTSLALAQVAAVLAVVATGSVATSASFSNTTISITVAGVVLYGTGCTMVLLGMDYPSPAHLLDDLPQLLAGDFSLAAQGATFIGWIALSLAIGLGSALSFTRRDV